MALLADLKTHTADCHRELEASMDVFERVATAEDYRALLRRFYTLYEPLEARLGAAADWGAAGWDFDAHRKTAWLREDLLALGVTEAELQDWPQAAALPAVADFGAAVGTLYVLEGSTLGGQMIARQFREKLGVTPERGGRFFHGYGEATGRRWREFGQWAEGQAQRSQISDTAVRGARETFGAFAEWMSR